LENRLRQAPPHAAMLRVAKDLLLLLVCSTKAPTRRHCGTVASSGKSCNVRCWPTAEARAGARHGRLMGSCGLSLVLAARNRVPRLPPSAIGASPAAGGRKTWWLLMTQSCRRADYQKRSDEIMHSHNLLWRRPKMKGPRRLVRRGADQHMERRTEKKANAQEPPSSRDLAIACGR